MSGIPGVGVKTAHAALRRHRSVSKALPSLLQDDEGISALHATLRGPTSRRGGLHEQYLEVFKAAKAVFRHQLIWDPKRRDVAPLRELEDSGEDGPRRFSRLLGAPMSASAALALCCEASFDPVTLLSTRPAPSRPPTDSRSLPESRHARSLAASGIPPPPSQRVGPSRTASAISADRLVNRAPTNPGGLSDVCGQRAAASVASANSADEGWRVQPPAPSIHPKERASRFFASGVVDQSSRLEQPCLPGNQRLDPWVEATQLEASSLSCEALLPPHGRHKLSEPRVSCKRSRGQPESCEEQVDERGAPRGRAFDVPRVPMTSPTFLDKFRLQSTSAWPSAASP